MKLAKVFLSFILLTLAVNVWAQANGRNVNFVRFDGGTFERTYNGEWLEFSDGSNNPKFRWREMNRDDWSVYFRDDSRNMSMQIDLHRKWIRLEWPGHPMTDQWPVTESSERVNGRLVTQVNHNGGSFRMVSPGQWREFNAAGQATFSFRENNRDQWSVYLSDDSRKMQMQIDVHRNWIRLAWPGHPMADQYQIVSSH
ncbi:MAG: hypothetical protein R3E95_12135 [Thiolinea sp.]